MQQVLFKDRVESALFLGANVFGELLYLCVVLSIVHTREMEQRDDYDFGDSLNYIMFDLPILAFFFVANITLVVRAIIDFFRRASYSKAVAFVVIGCLWMATFEYESYLKCIPREAWHWYDVFNF